MTKIAGAVAACLLIAASPITDVYAKTKIQANETAFIEIAPRFNFIISSSTILSSNGAVLTNVKCSPTVTKIEVVTELQRKDSSGWTSIDVFTKTFNSATGTLRETSRLQKGKTYQLYTTYLVYVGSNCESHSEYSSVVRT